MALDVQGAAAVEAKSACDPQASQFNLFVPGEPDEGKAGPDPLEPLLEK